MRRSGRARAPSWAIALVLAAPAACAGTPWFIGEPLEGKLTIPPTTRAPTVADWRGIADRARGAGQQRIELAALLALESRAALDDAELSRLATLLDARAGDWEALARPIPLARDLAHLVTIDPSRAGALAARRAIAETAAATLWRGIGDAVQAAAASRRAQETGRAGSAEVVEGVRRLAETAAGDQAPDASVALVEPPAGDWLLRGPTLARALIPLAAQFPQLLAPSPRAQSWAVALVSEDPTGPDSLEIAARIDALAGHLGGAERKLQDLVYYSPDRSRAHARAAAVWAEIGKTRRACAEWAASVRRLAPASYGSATEADRVRDIDGQSGGAAADPGKSRACALLACLERDRGAGDAEAWKRQLATRWDDLTCED